MFSVIEVSTYPMAREALARLAAATRDATAQDATLVRSESARLVKM